MASNITYCRLFDTQGSTLEFQRTCYGFDRVKIKLFRNSSTFNFLKHPFTFKPSCCFSGVSFKKSLKLPQRMVCNSKFNSSTDEQIIEIKTELKTQNSLERPNDDIRINEGDATIFNEKNLSSSPPFAWLGKKSSSPEEKEKVEEKTRIMLQKLADDQKRKWMEKSEAKNLLEMQQKREYFQQFNIKKNVLKFQGKLKGSPYDPVAGDEIRFSDFLSLVERKAVKFVEHAEHGKDVAVILPHLAESVSNEEQQKLIEDGTSDSNTPAQPKPLIWVRHPVQSMPVDMQTEVWKDLRTQVVSIDFKYPNSVLGQVMPTFGLALTWGLRLAIAVLLYSVLDRILFPIYRPRGLKDRPDRTPMTLKSAMQGDFGGMGESRARFISAEESTGVTFDDFAGQEYVKRELKEVVSLLKDEGEYDSLGVYCPKGVMLFGPPGTGKTLLARAIAGESGLPFFSVSGAEFVEMFVGVAASRVRSLFEKARQFAPSIIFIDEIDAIGSKRGLGEAGGGNVEREQGLMQILTEMDGFKVNQQKVLVIGATNRLDMLDPALLRKGRFDRVVAVQRPTEEGRLAILKVHSRNKDFKSEEEKEDLLKEVSELTYDYSGAELQNVMNEAAILALRKEKPFIEREELMEAIQRQAGEFKTGQEDKEDVSGESKLRICYREAAMCIFECILPDKSRNFVSTRSDDLSPDSHMVYEPVRHMNYVKKEDIINTIIRTFASITAEEMIFGKENVAWNMNSYVGEASQLTEYLILRTGMTALGSVVYNTEADLMPHMIPKVIALRDEILRYCLEKCRSYLLQYRSALETIAERLMEKEEIEAAEVLEIFNATPLLPMPHVREIDELAAMMYAGRWGIHGVSLPGRTTFAPGNVGYATFGAPRPQQVQQISDRTWKALEDRQKANIEEWGKNLNEENEELNVDLFAGIQVV